MPPVPATVPATVPAIVPTTIPATASLLWSSRVLLAFCHVDNKYTKRLGGIIFFHSTEQFFPHSLVQTESLLQTIIFFVIILRSTPCGRKPEIWKHLSSKTFSNRIHTSSILLSDVWRFVIFSCVSFQFFLFLLLGKECWHFRFLRVFKVPYHQLFFFFLWTVSPTHAKDWWHEITWSWTEVSSMMGIGDKPNHTLVPWT